MDRINGAGHVNRRFVSEDPAKNRPPTEFTPEFFNGLQEEGMSLIEGAGLVPDVNDNTQVRQAIIKMIEDRARYFAVDTGTVNNYIVAYTPEVKQLGDGLLLWFKAKTSNTGAATIAINGLPAIPLVGAALSDLQGGEIVANGRCMAVYSSTTKSCILIACTGGAVQVAPGTQTNQAVNLGQFGSLLAANGYQKLPGGLILQWGTGVFVSNSTTTVNLPIAFPVTFVGVIATPRDNAATVSSTPFCAALPLSNTSFSMRNYYSQSALAITWFALGY